MENFKKLNISDDSLISTNLINKTYKSLQNEGILTPLEKDFLNPTDNIFVDINKNSLTNTQNIQHQLRFFEQLKALRLINNIAYKLSKYISEEKIKIEYTINTQNTQKPSLFFIERLSHYLKESDLITVKFQNFMSINQVPEISLNSMKEYLRVGDSWTAKYIGEELLNIIDEEEKAELYYMLAMANNTLNETLTGENLLQRVLKENNNERITSAYYVLSMLYIRHHPRAFIDISKTEQFLDTAYKLLTDKNFQHNTKEFSAVFNRNGYALVLFRKKKIKEAIKLLTEKINTLNTIIHNEKYNYGVLHKSVLMYNLAQCYNSIGDIEKTIETYNEVIKIDPNDPDYRYELIRILFMNEKYKEAHSMLLEIEKENLEELSIHQSLKGYYYLVIGEFTKAQKLFKEAIYFNFEKEIHDELIYNYFFTLYNKNEFNKILDLLPHLNLQKNNNYHQEINTLINLITDKQKVNQFAN
ncbi:tetratricopeptide repeat protein [Bacillus cereus]|uniref:tetratricopeptide repeat protein n=1 Tax=Bacillus cereus TaxID=1396 RepID=UPI0039782B9F